MSDKSMFERVNAGEFKNLKPYPSGDLKRDSAESRRLRAEYGAETYRLESLFRKGLEEEFGDSRWPQELLDTVYTQAWREGHASGYHEVAGYYMVFSDLARIAFDCGHRVATNA